MTPSLGGLDFIGLEFNVREKFDRYATFLSRAFRGPHAGHGIWRKCRRAFLPGDEAMVSRDWAAPCGGSAETPGFVPGPSFWRSHRS